LFANFGFPLDVFRTIYSRCNGVKRVVRTGRVDDLTFDKALEKIVFENKVLGVFVLLHKA